MDKDPSEQHWLINSALRRVTTAEARFSAAMRVNQVTMLAAADELDAATNEAMAWIVVHPCPDSDLGVRVAFMLNICAEVALTAQHALAHPCGDIEALFGRLGNHLASIDFHSRGLHMW